ncbi:hypothetical protein HOK51_03115 [Candidatus Woesearchaeota archaeon]|jgi:hypothetical protein|nr:hypothetical protein [Candidatus Woesearchaeota archaeon]MBT6518809.1 hypothetical protein [Candidatus Woesearchaeota archaeon]MBT7367948.1 hypothetical protein [Candidatus Woesearchaeota archaeon]
MSSNSALDAGEYGRNFAKAVYKIGSVPSPRSTPKPKIPTLEEIKKIAKDYRKTLRKGFAPNNWYDISARVHKHNVLKKYDKLYLQYEKIGAEIIFVGEVQKVVKEFFYQKKPAALLVDTLSSDEFQKATRNLDIDKIENAIEVTANLMTSVNNKLKRGSIVDMMINANPKTPERIKEITQHYLQLLNRFETRSDKQELYSNLFSYLCYDKEKTSDEVNKLNNAMEQQDWLIEQKTNQLIPLARIVSDTEEKHYEKIKELSDHNKNKLCYAYEIATRNYKPLNPADIFTRTKENYSKEFFKGLNETLDKDYDNLNKWCKTIIEGLQEVARTGQSLDEVMSYE